MGIICLTAFISPLNADRARIKEIIGRENLIEIFCDCSLEICEKRDVKGLYKKARQGLIENYTGISSPYEVPSAPDLRLDTGNTPLADCVDAIVEHILQKKIIHSAFSRE